MSGNAAVKILGVGLAAAIASALYYLWIKRQRRCNHMPIEWGIVGTLEEIYFYPIKSCCGIAVKESECSVLGLRQSHYKDRMFMLVDEDNKAVTGRTYPKMLHIKPKINDDQLVVTAPGMPDLIIDSIEIGAGEMLKTDLWKLKVFAVQCGEKYNKWFSKYILEEEQGLKLVYYSYPVPVKNIVEKIFDNGIFTKDDTGTLQDVSSYMLINNDSTQYINELLEKKVKSYQYRPNFVIKTITKEAFIEDKWDWIRIGDVVFRSLAPCYRCIFINIDPDSAELDRTEQPLKTLKMIRNNKNAKSPMMGLQLGLRLPGKIHIGDTVFIGLN